MANTTAANITGCVAIGNNASSANVNAVAIGTSAIASGNTSIAIKGNATTSGAIAIGNVASATGNNYSIAIGVSSTASNNKSIALGNTSLASGTNSMSLGYISNATQVNSLALGTDARSLAGQGIAVGSHLEVLHNNSIILGQGISNTTGNRLLSTNTNQLVIGFDSITPTMVIGATTDSYIKSTGNLSLETDTTVKASNNSESTTGFKVTDINNSVLLDVRNNGQIAYGGVFDSLYAHKFRNPNNEANIASFDNDASGTKSFLINTNGSFQSQLSGQTIFQSYRQAGQSYIKLYDAGVESIRFNKGNSFINGPLRVGGISGSAAGTTGARFEIQQASSNTYQQLFFANVRSTTLGFINSSGSYGNDQKGLEGYDTDKNKKFFWNGTAWEKIKGNIESVSVASATTITPNIDISEMEIVSALAGALTIAVPTGVAGSFFEGKELNFRIKDNGTARALTWNAIFVDYTGILPTTTVASKTVYIGCKYNVVDTKWDVVAVQVQP